MYSEKGRAPQMTASAKREVYRDDRRLVTVTINSPEHRLNFNALSAAAQSEINIERHPQCLHTAGLRSAVVLPRKVDVQH